MENEFFTPWIGYYDLNNEEEIRRHYKKTFANTRKQQLEEVGMIWWKDMDQKRYERRMETAWRTLEHARQMIGEDYPFFPGVTHFERDWSFLNSTMIGGYDEIEHKYNLLYGAALWILDILRSEGTLYETEITILPKLQEKTAEKMENYLLAEDFMFSQAEIMKVCDVLIRRNDDCKVYKSKNEPERHILDEATVRGKHRQDVPSRQTFERLLQKIPEEYIEDAVSEFKRLYWLLARNFFAGLRENHTAKDKVFKHHDRLLRQFRDAEQRLSARSTSGLPYSEKNGSRKTIQEEELRTLQSLNDTFDRCVDESDRLIEEKEDMAFCLREYMSMSEFSRNHFYSEEFNRRMKEFRIDDPYKLCFAVLYMADREDELIWTYFFSCSLAQMIGETLPWKDKDDLVLIDLFEEDPAAAPAEPLCLYQPKYEYPEEEEYMQESCNLAQILYKYSGVIPPRDLHLYDPVEEDLIKYGFDPVQRQAIRAALSAMYALGCRGDDTFDDEETGLSVIKEEDTNAAAQISSLKEQLRDLRKENKRLSESAWKAQAESRKLQEQLNEIRNSTKEDLRELADLRELVFLSRTETEETEDPDIHLPVSVTERTVVCGGHATFLKQFSPLVAGNVKYLNNMRVNEDLVRNADSIWIQTNAISHSDYYKIVAICRKYNIPVHYFKYASARKCAEQIAMALR